MLFHKGMTTAKKNMLPPGLVNNLQEVLLSRKGGNSNTNNDEQQQKPDAIPDSPETSTSASDENDIS